MRKPRQNKKLGSVSHKLQEASFDHQLPWITHQLPLLSHQLPPFNRQLPSVNGRPVANEHSLDNKNKEWPPQDRPAPFRLLWACGDTRSRWSQRGTLRPLTLWAIARCGECRA